MEHNTNKYRPSEFLKDFKLEVVHLIRDEGGNTDLRRSRMISYLNQLKKDVCEKVDKPDASILVVH